MGDDSNKLTVLIKNVRWFIDTTDYTGKPADFNTYDGDPFSTNVPINGTNVLLYVVPKEGRAFRLPQPIKTEPEREYTMTNTRSKLFLSNHPFLVAIAIVYSLISLTLTVMGWVFGDHKELADLGDYLSKHGVGMTITVMILIIIGLIAYIVRVHRRPLYRR